MIARILTLSQIQYFCSIAGHEYFTEVPDSFIEDQFNLTGLHGQVPFYQEAMSMILDGGYGTEPLSLASTQRELARQALDDFLMKFAKHLSPVY